MENQTTMNYDELSELASTRIIDMVDQLSVLQESGDKVSMAILHEEIKSLTHALDADDEVLAMTYHRHLSESFGMVFEVEHGDPELMFGCNLT